MLLFLFVICLFVSCAESSDTSEKQPVREVASSVLEDTLSVKPSTTSNLAAAAVGGDVVDTIPLSWVMGKITYAKDSSFVKIPARYADREGLYLHKAAFEAYLKMYEAAKKDGIHLKIRSAARNFDYQKGIWERKFNGITKVDGENLAQSLPNKTERAKKILEYSSMPGTSRHHWGTDIDLNAFTNAYFESGTGKKIYDWLLEHAESFGFCQPYTPISEQRKTGYFEEKWHWSYLPVANKYLATAQKHLSATDIVGFDGHEAAVPLDVVNAFVLGINKECLGE